MPVALATWLPKGAGLSPEAWQQRHRFLVWVLWAQVPLLGLFTHHPVLHLPLELGLIALYQDWRPLLLALGYVVVHHGAMSVIDPHAIYSDARDVRAGLSQMVVTTPRTRVGDEVGYGSPSR
jgi:hypothetical protein